MTKLNILSVKAMNSNNYPHSRFKCCGIFNGKRGDFNILPTILSNGLFPGTSKEVKTYSEQPSMVFEVLVESRL